MRWLKHLTATRNDERVAALMDRLGYEGYGLWWAILETIAGSMEKGDTRCSLHYPVSKWAAELQLSPPNVYRRLARVCATGLLEMSRDETSITLCAPNLMKYRDEYSRKSGHAPDSVGSKIQSTETETETEFPSTNPVEARALPGFEEPPRSVTPRPEPTRRIRKQRSTDQIIAAMGTERGGWFTELWAIHPAGSKRDAAERFEELKPTPDLWEQIKRGAEAYTAWLAANPDRAVKHLSGWIKSARWEGTETAAQREPPAPEEWKPAWK